MDYRTALTPNTQLRFNTGTLYTIRGEIGRGGSCIVYDGFYLTNAGDEKTVRIKELYPYDLHLRRDTDSFLRCDNGQEQRFASAKEQMYADFRRCNAMFYADESSDSILNTINIYEANNTVYVVSAWSHENALPNLKINKMKDCISIVRQTAYAVRCIHKAGYLYLDIKPDNISVVNALTRRIQLFDFDSLIPISAIQDNNTSGAFRLSYTKGFAALELRKGELRRLGPHTDVYGIGALLFFLIFGRTPEAPDCGRNASYDFSGLRFPESCPDRFYILLTDFFHKTLASLSADRFRSMEPAVRALEEIEKLADPAYPYLISTPFSAPAWFIGRERESRILNDWCRDETKQVLFLSGMGGIGKSTFVRRVLSAERQLWDSIVFLYFGGSLRQTFLNDAGLHVNGMERFPEESEADYFERKLRKLREIIRRDRVLLVIDNFTDEHDPDLDVFLGLACKKIFITRHDLGSLNLPILKLEALPDMADLQRLFIHYLGRETVSETDAAAIQAIIRRLSSHTLAIELFARQVSNSFLTLSEALEMLEKQGILHVSTDRIDYQRDDSISYEQLESIITRLFETNSLSAGQISILKALALFPAPGIGPRELMRFLDIENAEAIRQLIRYGWITRDAQNIFLHPLIRDVVQDLPVTGENLQGVLKTLETLHDDIASESHIEELLIDPAKISPELAEILSKIDPFTIVTDQRKLLKSVMTARGVIDRLMTGPLWGSEPVQKLLQKMVTNLPKYEDEAILYYGQILLETPEHLSPAEIIDVIDKVQYVLLEHHRYDEAESLMELAKHCAADDRTRAEYYSLAGNICDTRDAPGDREKVLEFLNLGIGYARKAPHSPRKHLLAQFLLGKMNAIARRGFGDPEEFDTLFNEMRNIVENECLPCSEICHGFAITMGFYWAEGQQNREEAEKCIENAGLVAKRLFQIGLDYIDFQIIPPAIMYIDLQAYDACEAVLKDGIRICDDHAELTAYLRKKHDLERYLLDVYLEGNEPEKAREMVKKLDEECRQYAFPDTVSTDIRDWLNSLPD